MIGHYSYVITETKVKISYSFPIKAGQFGIFLMMVEGPVETGIESLAWGLKFCTEGIFVGLD